MHEQVNLHFGDMAKGYVGIMNRHKGPPTFCLVHEVQRVLLRRPSTDLYVSLNTFAKPNHSAENVWQYSAIYVGCDTRQKGLDPDDALEEMKRAYFGTITLPEPSYAILSGNGVWLVWLINPVTAGRRTPWQHVQRHFNDVLWLFGPDPNDAAKYIRVTGSTNSSSGSTVRLEVLSGQRYELDTMLEYAPPLPVPASAPRRERAPSETEPAKRKRKPLLPLRIGDLETLCSRRHGRLDHCRNYFLTIYASTVYGLTHNEDAVLAATQELNLRVSPPLPNSQVRAIVRTCTKRLYRWTTATIIDRLQISESEQQFMRTLRSPELAQRQRADQGSAMAKVARNRFARARERMQAIMALKQQGGTSNREIARRLGITEGTVRHALKQLQAVRN